MSGPVFRIAFVWLMAIGCVVFLAPLWITQAQTEIPTKLKKENPEALNKQVARLYHAGKYAEAVPIARRYAKAMLKLHGESHPKYATAINNLGELYRVQAFFKQAEQHYRKALAIREKSLGPGHPETATDLNNLAVLFHNLGLYEKAELFFKRAMKIEIKSLGPDHIEIAHNLNNLAELYRNQGRYNEAEPLHKRALEIKENKLKPDDPDIALTLNNLALLFDDQNRAEEAELYFKRALEIDEKALGENHPGVATDINNLADFYRNQKRYGEAEKLHNRVLAIRKKTGGVNHPNYAASLNNLGFLYDEQGRFVDAESLFLKALQIKRNVFGSEHPDFALSLNNLAGLYSRMGKYEKAKPLFEEALRVRREKLGLDHLSVAATYSNLAKMSFEQSDWQKATQYGKSAVDIVSRRVLRQRSHIGKKTTGKGKSETTQNIRYFLTLLKAAYRLQFHDDTATGPAYSPMFKMAQWSIGSKAAGALAQMSARQAKGSNRLAELVRERQDLAGEWQALDKRLILEKSKLPKWRSKTREKQLFDRLKIIDERFFQIDTILNTDFPEYTALANPTPVTIEQVQAQLGKDEALLVLLDTPALKPTPAETFIWAVTKNKAVWKRSELGGKALGEKVAKLRKALGQIISPRSKALARKPGEIPEWEGMMLEGKKSFDLETAHKLYEKLPGPVEEVIRGKTHLMVVASGPLTALPLQLLVTKKPDDKLSELEKYQKADWLIRRHALTTLPSVASLKALRGTSRNGPKAAKQLIGFADPVFSRDKKKPTRLATADQGRNRGFASFFRGAQANLKELGKLDRLPKTQTELKAIAKTLGVPESEIRLREAAIEEAVKALNRKDEKDTCQNLLDNYRIVYFATHGLVAGTYKNLAEPALALTVPEKATKIDDGLLTASEVTTLKLDADWVVMSACNTAAADKPGAEALSELARAFFYAGAKTLLVSHWLVNDGAAVKLTTHTFKKLNEARKNGDKLGRSQALQQAMVAMIDHGGLMSHPVYWAPFVVVGEGAGQ